MKHLLLSFSSIGFLFKESDFLTFPFFVYKDLAFLLGGQFVMATAVFLSTFYFKVIFLASFGVLLSVFEDVFKEDLLIA